MDPSATAVDRRAAYIMSGAPGANQAYGTVFGQPPMTPPLATVMPTSDMSVLPPVRGPPHVAVPMPPVGVPPSPGALGGAGAIDPTGAAERGKGGIPAGAYAPVRFGFGQFPPVRADLTDRIFNHCLPARLRASRWWTPSYIADYLLLLLIWIGTGIMWFWYDEYHRVYHVPPPATNGDGFAWYDNKYNFPIDEDEAISPAASVVLSFVVPVVLFAIFAIVRRSFHDFHNALLGIGEAIGIGYIIQIPITRATGMFRPDMLYRMLSGDDDRIREGRRAFPSGHAMIAFCGYGFLAFYFMGKTKVFHAAYGNLWRIVVCLAPIAAAVGQAVTRIHDNRHSPVDIVGGAFIGLGAAWICYFANFPGLSNRFCGRPKNRKARLESDWYGMMVDY